MKLKKMLCFFLVLCLVIPSVSTFVYDKAEAEETKDAFGIKMEDTSLTPQEKNEIKANNPYGTDNWFPLSTITELYVARGNNSNRYFNTYDYNGTNMGDTGSIGNVFKTAKNERGKSEGNKDGYHFMDTAGCDVYGEGQKKYTVSVGYNINKRIMEMYLTDASGNQISNLVTLGTSNTLDYLKEADAYENTGFISVAAGDFDGDGKDSVVVYVPEMESSDDNHKPAIYMYDISGTQLTTTPKRIKKVYDLLGCDDLSTKSRDNGQVFRNAPVVQLVAEDTDKDNVDELIITAGLNHTHANVSKKQSQMFIMDYNDISKSWNKSFELDTGGDNGYNKHKDGKRLRWASSSVGNISMQNSVDYPEIITAGWIDKSNGNNTDLMERVGSYLTTCDVVTKNEDGVSIGSYTATMIDDIGTSEFTYGGHYEDDDVQCLLPVAAFLADGIGSPASVLISDTVYTLNDKGELDEENLYRDGYFNDDDDGIGSSIISNGLVQDVVVGNFDGNEEGREQVIFTTCQKRQSFSQYFNKIYTYQKDKDGKWSKQDTGYFFNKKNYVFVSLCALDTDNDSTIVKLEDVERTYTEPEVLALLESTPYFAEIDGGDTGNSETAYGTAKEVGGSTGTSNGLSTEIIAGYEMDIAGNGAEFELSIENNFTWETVETETTEYSLNWSNDTGDNMVVVYRRPVTSWKYKVKNKDSDLVLAKQGELLTSLISVDAYNEAAQEYEGLDEISDKTLAEPGNPLSYRSSLLGLDDPVPADDWTSYNGSGTIAQALTYTKETENSFTYELNTSFTACAKVFGVKAGGGAGYSYSNTTSTLNTSSITKSGTVTSIDEEGYDFSWKFAHWTTTLNGSRIPVLGYILKGVSAPPSPPQNLTVSEVAQTTATINWDQGQRSADEYRIYQVYEDGSKVQIGVVDGTETSYQLTRLRTNTAYTYELTAYSASGKCNGESVPSEQVKVTTLPEGVASVEMVHPEDQFAEVGGTVSFSADINVISEDYQATNYQWQKHLKGESWEDIHGATQNTLTVSDVEISDNQAQYRCIFKVAYTSTAAMVRYYSNPATLTVGKIPLDVQLEISGYDTNANGDGSLDNPYKGLSDYQVKGDPITETRTNNVHVETDDDLKLTVHKYTSNGEISYYGIGTTESGDVVYYTVTKTTSADGKETYTADQLIQEVNTTIYSDLNDNTVANPPECNIDELFSTTEDGETYYLRCVVEGNQVSETDTRLMDASGYTFYWYKDGQYYSYEEGGGVGTTATPSATEDKIFDVYLFTNESETKTETRTETDSETNTEKEVDIDITTTTETVVLGRVEEWKEDDTSTAGYLCTRLVKTTVKEGDQDPTVVPFVVTVMKISEETSYQVKGSEPVQSVPNPSTWELLTKESTEEVKIPTYQQMPGSKLTLTATVKEKDGTAAKGAAIDFQIINTKTNAQTSIIGTAVEGQTGVFKAEWTADASGIYQIKAVVRSDSNYAKRETDSQYYEAQYTYENNTTEYRLKLMKGDTDTLGVITFGDTVLVQMQERTVDVSEQNGTTYGEWASSSENVTLTCVDSFNQSVDIQNKTLTPKKAGVYTIYAYGTTATENGETARTLLANTSLLVNKAAITVIPNWEYGQTPQNAENVTLSAVYTVSSGSLPLMNEELKSVFDISCGYFDMSNGEKTEASGRFDVTAKYKVSANSEGTEEEKAAADAEVKEKVNAFKNDYLVTFETKTFTVQAHSAQVNFSSGENGTINGLYTNHYYPMVSGSSKTAETKLRFQAVANSGYAVDYWKINGDDYYENDNNLPNGMKLNEARTLLDIDSFNLTNHTVSNNLTVQVFYKSVSKQVTFSVAESGNGTIEAVNSTGNAFTSGTYIRNGSSVTLTATPAAGYVVDQWLVNNEIYHWSGTEEAYRGTTLTLEDIQSAQNVVVSFKELYGTYTITAGVADEAGYEEASLAKITAVNAETQEAVTLPAKAAEGTSITFKATVTNDSVNMVKEWQVSTDDGATYETAKGSGGSDTFTLYNVGSDTIVRAIVTKAQTYTLSYNVLNQDTGSDADTNIASLTVTSNGQSLETGKKASAYIPVAFDLSLNDNYYVVGWSSNSSGNNVTFDEADKTKAEIGSLTADTSVTVTIAEKPVVSYVGTYRDNEGNTTGTVTATMPDPSDETKEITVNTGDHVAPGTDVTFIFTPNTGYVVNAGAVKANDDTPMDTTFVDGSGDTTDIRTCTISNIQSDQKVEAAFTALDRYDVTYNVVNTIVGQVDGTLTASAGRKGLQGYKIDNLKSGASVCAGSDLTFTATPKPGYQVKQWKVNGVVQSDEGGLTVTTNTLHVSSVNGPVTVTVEFIQSGNKIFIQAGENGQIVSAFAGGSDQIANIGSGFTLGENASVVITAQADAGYEVKEWKVNNETVLKDGEPITDLTYTYKADGTKSGANIAVYFQQIPYQVSWSGQDGTVTAQDYDGNSANIRGGSKVTFTVAPDEGQMFDYWTVNGVKVENENSDTFTWTVPNGAAQNPAVSEYKIQAVCKEAPFKVTYTQPANGSLTAKVGSKEIATGDTVEGNTVVTFTAAPNSGYMVGSWSVNDETITSQENTLDVTVKKDTKVSVTLIPDTYTVTAETEGSGTIAVGTDDSRSYQAQYGTSLTFTATAEKYWEIGDWYVDGEKVTEGVSSDNSTFTLTNITKNQTVKVEFIKAVYYEVSYSVEGESGQKNGTLTAEADDKTLNLSEGDTTNVRGGAELTFTATPDDDYMVDQWTINGETVDDNISNTFSIPSLGTKVDVKVLYTQYEGFVIPESGNGYIVEDVTRTPDDTVPKGEIRQNGDLTFTVRLDEEKGFNTLSNLIVKGYDCIAGKLVDENQPITGCDTLKSVKNEDGSYTITIKNVTADIGMTVEAHIFNEEEAVFNWTDNNTKATVELTCGDTSCQEEPIVLPCKVDMKRGDGKLTFTASAEYMGRTFTQTITTDHKLTKVPAKVPTCKETGNIEHWVCNDKNCPDGIKKFADEKGNKVLTDGQVIIPVDKVNGHDYSQSNVTFQWSEDGSVKTYVICSRCGEKKEIGCTVTQEEGIGTMTYTATAVFNNQTYTDVKTVQCTNSWADTVLRVQATASKKSIKLKWNAVPNADGYVIYWNKCLAENSFKQKKVIESGEILTWTHKNLKKNSWNKYFVKAYKEIDGKKYFIKKSNEIHLATKGGPYTNVKKLKSSVSKVTLKKGKTKTLKITQTYAEKNKKLVAHMRPLTYTTSDKKVATVTKKGVIKAKGKGNCYIYITAFSGVYTRVKVTVK